MALKIIYKEKLNSIIIKLLMDFVNKYKFWTIEFTTKKKNHVWVEQNTDVMKANPQDTVISRGVN